MVELAVRAQLGEKLQQTGLLDDIPFYAVKGPVFSTVKLGGVDPALGPEMKSTGEVIGLSYDLQKAFGKSLHWKEGVCPPLVEGDTLFISLSDDMKQEFPSFLPFLQGMKVAATPGTVTFLKEHGLKEVVEVTEIEQVKALCQQGVIKALVNTPTMGNKRGRFGFELRQLAVQLHIPCFTSLDTFSSYLQVKPGAAEEPLDLGVYLQRERVTK